jgi:hypothetical protein
MWRLLREGLRFYRPTLLISWGFGAGIFFLVLVVVALVGSVADLNEMARARTHLLLAILVASMIAGFIATGTERSENRVRMHMMLPVPLRQVAVARVLLPAAFMLLGLAVSHVLFGLLLAIEGSPVLSPRHGKVVFLGLQLLFWNQLGLAVRELIELRHRLSWRAALGPKALLAITVALMVLVQLGSWEGVALRAAGVAALTFLVMTLTVVLFCRRALFTR